MKKFRRTNLSPAFPTNCATFKGCSLRMNGTCSTGTGHLIETLEVSREFYLPSSRRYRAVYRIPALQRWQQGVRTEVSHGFGPNSQMAYRGSPLCMSRGVSSDFRGPFECASLTRKTFDHSSVNTIWRGLSAYESFLSFFFRRIFL